MGKRSSRRVVHEQSAAGAPVANTNAQKRIELPSWLNLESSENVLRFMREVLAPSAIKGKLGVRTVTALTTLCKVLLDYESLAKLEKRIMELEKVKKP